MFGFGRCVFGTEIESNPKNLCKVIGDNVLKAMIHKTQHAIMKILDEEAFTQKFAEFKQALTADVKMSSLQNISGGNMLVGRSSGHIVIG